METPDIVSSRSPAAMHTRGGDGAHMQITRIEFGDKLKYFLLAASLVVNVLCLAAIAFSAIIFYQAKALDQNRYDWLQREVIDPLQRDENEHDKEINALMNSLIQEKRK